MQLPPSRFDFPDPLEADPHEEGLICMGGDLAPSTLLAAYTAGLFPWFNADEPICWWSPAPRCIIVPTAFVPSKSLCRNLKKFAYQIRIDHDFAQVIRQCAAPRAYADATWISSGIIDSYCQLHQLGYAHSIEVWDADELVGGLYGLSLGRGFFGESMFNRRVDCSKMAFYALMRICAEQNCPWVDCQLPNDHLMSLGAELMSRPDYLHALKQVLQQPEIDWKIYQNRVFLTHDLANPATLLTPMSLLAHGAMPDRPISSSDRA